MHIGNVLYTVESVVIKLFGNRADKAFCKSGVFRIGGNVKAFPHFKAVGFYAGLRQLVFERLNAAFGIVYTVAKSGVFFKFEKDRGQLLFVHLSLARKAVQKRRLFFRIPFDRFNGREAGGFFLFEIGNDRSGAHLNKLLIGHVAKLHRSPFLEGIDNALSL